MFTRTLLRSRLLLAITFILGGVIMILPAIRLIVAQFQLQLMGVESISVVESTHTATPTPFLPVITRKTYLPIVNQAIPNVSEAQLQREPLSVMGEVDFSPGAEQITIRVTPPDSRINGGNPLDMTFLPDSHCVFGDRRACIYTFLSPGGKNVVLASLHSGVGGEGQAFRHALEGTGFNMGLYTVDRVYENAWTLAGAGISLLQGGKIRTDFELIKVARIPPEYIQTYFALPVEDTLQFAVDIQVLEPQYLDQDLLVFETCGWRLPGDRWAPGVSDTTGSVYLGLVRAVGGY